MLISKDKLTGSKGQILVEVILAVVIFSVVVLSSAVLFFSGQTLVTNATMARHAMERARDGLEGTRAIRDRNWKELTDGIHGIAFNGAQWQLTSVPDIEDDITRAVTISTDLEGLKHITSSASWDTHSVALSQVLAPLEQGIYGDWTQPCILGSIDGGPGNQGNDVFYADRTAYVATSAAAISKPDLYIYDVSYPANPSVLSEFKLEQGIKSVTVSGNYAYTIEEKSTDFFVVNVSSRSSPFTEAKINLGNGDGKYVMVRDNYVYATTSSRSGPEFFVIDVSAPQAPQVVSSLDLKADVNEVSVIQNVAYLATSSDNKELILIDISNPFSPTEIGSYDIPGEEDARAVHAKSRSRIYLGRSQKGGGDEFFIFDATNPAFIIERGSEEIGSSIHSLITVATLSFVGADQTNLEFQAYNILDPLFITYVSGLNLPNIATGADYNNNVVYVSLRSNDILKLITSTQNGTCGGL